MRQNRLCLSFLAILIFMSFTGCVKLNCPLPENLNNTVKKETLPSTSASADIKRNSWSMGDLCASRITFVENGKKWTLLLVRNTKQPYGPFWYLPHDNENSAFEAAVYASKKYGGGFLSIEADGNRYAGGKDPNRHFKPHSTYTRTVFRIIDTFKPKRMPYLTLHNNQNGHRQFGGEGTVSIRVTSPHSHSYPAGTIKTGKREGLLDEDSLVYLAGKRIDMEKVKALNMQGIHVKYERVTVESTDNSMSNYIALHKGHTEYINIEAEAGAGSTQKEMLDKVMKLIYRGKL